MRAPNSWLVPAVVATLCCFPITGVVAVYFASRVDILWDRGEDAAAYSAARKARAFVLFSLVLWAVATLVLAATGRLGRLFEVGVL